MNIIRRSLARLGTGLRLALLTLFGGLAITLTVGTVAAAPLKAGDDAPPFSLPGSDGKTYQLADFKGKQVPRGE